MTVCLTTWAGSPLEEANSKLGPEIKSHFRSTGHPLPELQSALFYYQTTNGVVVLLPLAVRYFPPIRLVVGQQIRVAQ
jgi:hypothetical protein